MRCNVLTLFPDAIEPYAASSILGRAQAKRLLTINWWNIRDYAANKHRTVDDTPYGGGAGMVMQIEPIDQTLEAVNQHTPRAQQHVIVLSARGSAFTQQKAAQLANQTKDITLICGRYEGIDQRVTDFLADEELSIGPYVLAGGELAAMVVLEAVARLLPGVLGNPSSLEEESHTTADVEYPQYTKPATYKGWPVPSVLLSGDHGAIRRWREEQRSRGT